MEHENQYQPDDKGVRTYMTWGLVLLALSLIFSCIAADQAAKIGLDLAAVLSGGGRGVNLWPMALGYSANILLYIGIAFVVLAASFDLLHRYRRLR